MGTKAFSRIDVQQTFVAFSITLSKGKKGALKLFLIL